MPKMDLTADEAQALRNSAAYVKRAEDWGTRRGQGKRVNGSVLGGMSDAPQGVKYYDDPQATVSLEAWEVIRVLGGLAGHDEDMDLAVGAIQNGYSPEDALLLAFRHTVSVR